MATCKQCGDVIILAADAGYCTRQCKELARAGTPSYQRTGRDAAGAARDGKAAAGYPRPASRGNPSFPSMAELAARARSQRCLHCGQGSAKHYCSAVCQAAGQANGYDRALGEMDAPAAPREHEQRAHRLAGGAPTCVLYALRVSGRSTALPRTTWTPGRFLGSELMSFHPCQMQDAQFYTSSQEIATAIAEAKKRVNGLVPELVTFVEETADGARAKVPDNLWGDDLFVELERQGLIDNRPQPAPQLTRCDRGHYYIPNPAGCGECFDEDERSEQR